PGGSTVTVPANNSTAMFTINTLQVSSSTSVDIKATYPTTPPAVEFHASLVVVNYTVQGTRRPLFLASLLPSEALTFGNQSPLRNSEPLDFRLNLGIEEMNQDPPVQRAPVVFVGNPPGPPKRNFIYSP